MAQNINKLESMIKDGNESDNRDRNITNPQTGIRIKMDQRMRLHNNLKMISQSLKKYQNLKIKSLKK